MVKWLIMCQLFHAQIWSQSSSLLYTSSTLYTTVPSSPAYWLLVGHSQMGDGKRREAKIFLPSLPGPWHQQQWLSPLAYLASAMVQGSKSHPVALALGHQDTTSLCCFSPRGGSSFLPLLISGLPHLPLFSLSAFLTSL